MEKLNLLKVQVKGKVGLIDTQGKVIVPIRYEDCQVYGEGKPFLQVKQDGKIVFLQQQGNTFRPQVARYDEVWLNDSYEDCFPALVREGKRWFYVSQNGKELPLYAEVRL